MRHKGQIFTLDFVISMVLVILAFGLVLNFMELNEYNLNEQEKMAELKTIGDAAADTLVSSPAIVCDLGYYPAPTDWRSISHLMNCIMPPPAPGKPIETYINKAILGLDAKDSTGRDVYGCRISFDSSAAALGPERIIEGGCLSAVPPGINTTYSVKRNVVIPNRANTQEPTDIKMLRRLEKSDLANIKGMNSVGVTLTVWRNDLP